MRAYLISVVLGYLLGCSSMALYISRFKGVDIAKSGTGNLGASNAMVLMGWGAGILVAVHDIGKAVLSVWLAGKLFPGVPLVGLAAGAACVMGHMFPFYLRFRGGKGLASYFGMILAWNWKIALIVFAAGVIITLVTNYIAIATVSIVIAFPIYLAFTASWPAVIVTAAVSLVMVWKHRENYRRIKNGTEVGFRKANSGELRVR